jgi:hypothetical protein
MFICKSVVCIIIFENATSLEFVQTRDWGMGANVGTVAGVGFTHPRVATLRGGRIQCGGQNKLGLGIPHPNRISTEWNTIEEKTRDER